MDSTNKKVKRRRGCPLILIIRDGWGINPHKEGNAIALGNTPFADSLVSEYPTCIVHTSGLAVGLPKGYQGNSEVGHLNLGAGRVVYQSLVRINNAIEKGKFFSNPKILDAYQNVLDNHSALHLMGLLQNQGVHAHINHLFALLELAKKKGIKDVVVHIFTDGRDTPPKSALGFIEQLKKKMKKLDIGRIGIVSGRYYAMDRDKRWKRTKLAYDALSQGKAASFSSAEEAVEDAYNKGETDEFIKPRKVGDYSGMQDNDSVIFYNYRFDRARQITKAFTEKDFGFFQREKRPKVHYLAFTKYYHELSSPVAFPPISMKNILGEVLSKNSLRQLRIAETEKYAHVTFFFNGQQDKPFPLEERILVPSPKVATYDTVPEMSAFKVTEKILKAIENDEFDVYILNFANPDMVGHTGVLEAAIKACETVDKCTKDVVAAITKKGGTAIIGADHGNAEMMLDEKTGKVVTAHTTNPVYYHLVSRLPELKNISLREGKLADIAPTMLDILGIDKPKEMKGQSLIINNS
jgi:2,3-bisphosphoglycerate-independent phosphoglycerate mutase